MRKYFPIYEEAVSHIRLCNCSILNFLMYKENLVLFFISAGGRQVNKKIIKMLLSKVYCFMNRTRLQLTESILCTISA